MIFTFYSYKGGVGRSMALASVARVLAGRGVRVLVVDFDLEAPGLEMYFLDPERAAAALAAPGLVDLLRDYRLALSDEAELASPRFKQLDGYIQKVRPAVGTRGGLVHLLGAGARLGSEAQRRYALAVRSFDWQDFYFNWKGDRFFDWLRRRWQGSSAPGPDASDSGYDVVLVDSRTGVTEMGGVCAYQLADVAVLLCAANQQNLLGTRHVADDFTSPGVLALRNGRPLQILALPARLEDEHPGRAQFLADFAREIGALGLPAALAAEGMVVADLALPYLSEFSIAEHQVGDYLEQGDARPAWRVFERLADALTLLATPGDRLAPWQDEVRQRRRDKTAPVAARLQADGSQTVRGWDVFLDAGLQDLADARALLSACTAAGLTVFLPTTDTPLRDSAGIDKLIEQAIDYSATLLVLFGRDTTTAWRSRLIEKARRSGRIRLLPVLWPGGAPEMLQAFDLAAQQALDLRPDGIAGAGLQRLLATLQATPAGAASVVAAADSRSPYPGAAPYREEDALAFHGRSAELAALHDAVRGHWRVLLQGASAVGKTSLVAAGLLPLLRKPAPGRTEAEVSRIAWISADTDADTDADSWPGWQRPRHTTADPRWELIVIDGVDAFPHGAGDAARAERWRRIEALSASCSVMRRLLLLWRGVLPPAERQALLRRFGGDFSTLSLGRLSSAGLREAIVVPARSAGQLLEAGLADRLQESVGDGTGALLQAQLALAALWAERRRGWLGNEELSRLGHVAGIVAATLAQQLAAHLARQDARGTTATRALLGALLAIDADGGASAPALAWDALATMPDLAGVDAVALRDQLAARGLITLDSATGSGATLALLRADPQWLYGGPLPQAELEWLQWRSRWRAAVQRADLPTSAQALAEARRWLALRHGALTAAERRAIADLEQQQRDGQLGFVLPAPAPVKGQARTPAGEAGGTRLQAVPGEDAVTLHLQNGPVLLLNPLTLRDLLQAQSLATGSAGGAAVQLEPTLRWAGIEALFAVAGPLPADIAQASAVPSKLEVLAWDGSATPRPDWRAAVAALEAARPGCSTLAAPVMPDNPKRLPMLLLLPGSFADVQTSFGALWQPPTAAWHALVQAHAGIVGWDGHTLSEDPLDQALALVRACPLAGPVVVLAHGAGGVLAEVLALAAELLPKDAPDARWAKLAHELLARGVRVTRVLRLATPLRGMGFCGGRLDVHLSLLRWALQLADRPVPAALDTLLAAAALQNPDPRQLPGLAALLPDSPLLATLGQAVLPGDLRILAADADPALGWFKLLAAEAPTWTDSDLLVQCRSATGGAARSGGAWLHVVQGGGVASHFGLLAQGGLGLLQDALLADAPAAGNALPMLSGPDLAPSAVMANRGLIDPTDTNQPLLLWLHGWPGDGPPQASSTGGPLAEALRSSHHVSPWPCDPLLPLSEQAQHLASHIERWLARTGSGQALRAVAHGSAALVLRALQARRPEIWQRWLQRDGTRIVLLGPWSGGAWQPLRLLSGDLAADAVLGPGPLHGGAAQRQRWAESPGLLALQAGLADTQLGLASSSAWRSLADDDLQALRRHAPWHCAPAAAEAMLGSYRWGVPPQTALDAAHAERRAIDRVQREPLPPGRMLALLGRAPQQAAAPQRGPTGVLQGQVQGSDAGDGMADALLATAPGVPCWQTELPHAALNQDAALLPALADLLQHGSTLRLPAAQPPPPTRALLTSRPREALAAQALQRALAALQVGPVATAEAGIGEPMQLQVLHGAPGLSPLPLLVGLQRGAREARLDDLDAALWLRLGEVAALGLLPQAPGSVLWRDVPPSVQRQRRTPAGVLLMGLGDAGALRAADLALALRSSIVALALRRRDAGQSGPFAAACLLPAASAGLDAGPAAQALAGAALLTRAQLLQGRLPLLARLLLVEPQHGRAAEAWHALRWQARLEPGLQLQGPLVVASGGVDSGPVPGTAAGATSRSLRISTAPSADGTPVLHFNLSSDTARSEHRGAAGAADLAQRLLASGRPRAELADTLQTLLLPSALLPMLLMPGAVALELDSAAAACPWEWLPCRAQAATGAEPAPPWAERASLLRRAGDMLPQPPAPAGAAATESAALLVCAPGSVRDDAVRALLGSAAPLLRTAFGEARVHLRGPGGRPARSAKAVLQALFDHDWSVLCLAGPARWGGPDAPAVVALDSDVHWGARELATLRRMPALVLVLGTPGRGADGTPPPAAWAAQLGRDMLAVGVQAVVVLAGAASAAVAEAVADALLRALLGGASLAEAAAPAHAAVRDAPGQTLLQLWGDADFSLPGTRRQRRSSSAAPEPLASALELRQRLQRLAARAAAAPWPAALADELRALLAQADAQSPAPAGWRQQGAVADAEAQAWLACGDDDAALAAWQRALAAPDGGASLAALPALGRLRLRAVWLAAVRAKGLLGQVAARMALEDLQQQLAAWYAAAPSAALARLQARACQRQSMLGLLQGQPALARAPLDACAAHLAVAEHLAPPQPDTPATVHAALLAVAVALMRGEHGQALAQAAALGPVCDRLAAEDAADTWALLAPTELALYMAVGEGRLAGALPRLLKALDAVRAVDARRDIWAAEREHLSWFFGVAPLLAGATEHDAADRLMQRVRSHATPATR